MARLALAREPRLLAVARLRNRLTWWLRGALLACLLLAAPARWTGSSWWLLLMLSAASRRLGLGRRGRRRRPAVRAAGLAPVLQQLAARPSAHTIRRWARCC